MTSASPLKCPSCGFAVFNRRYPKCERCKADLPADIAYSRYEVAALQAREASEERARREHERAPASAGGDTGWSTEISPEFGDT